jgi:hypothetical protein
MQPFRWPWPEFPALIDTPSVGIDCQLARPGAFGPLAYLFDNEFPKQAAGQDLDGPAPKGCAAGSKSQED